MSELTEHAERNRKQWDQWADDYRDAGRKSWGTNDITWGMWSVSESTIHALGDHSWYTNKDIVELGCGTAYWSAWFARMGARPIGIDNSPEQLATARSLQAEFNLNFPVDLGSAEALPYSDDSFDVAFSEYGASIWCDPFLWIPEAARVLRPEGKLIFLVNSPLLLMCTPLDGSQVVSSLERPQFGMHRFEWPDDNSVEFHLPHGAMIDVLASHDLRVSRLIELQAPEGATTTYDFVTPEWSRKWPSEEIWVCDYSPPV